MIPKNIIQICIGPDTQTSQYWMHLSKKWALDYPDWNHHVYDDQELEETVKLYSHDLWEMYRNCPLFSYKADIGRMALLYRHGGLYLDIDTRPKDDINQYLITSEEMQYGLLININEHEDPWSVVTNNHVIAAEKESPIIKYFIDEMISKYQAEESQANFNEMERAGFRFAKAVSTQALGSMFTNYLSNAIGTDFIRQHIAKGYGKIGLFWVTWDGKEIKTRKFRSPVAHVGSILITDFADTNPNKNAMGYLSQLYEGLYPHNGEIKIYAGGLDGI